MPELVYFIAATADGHIAAPDGSFDFFPMGDHVAAQAAELPETLPAHLRELLDADDEPRRFATVVMGRKTYEPALEAGITDPYAPLDTIVFSRTLEATVQGGLTITADDPSHRVAQLKARNGEGDIWLCGGTGLASELIDQIDEVIIKVNPVLTGAGLPLFDAPFQARPLTLLGTRRFDSGVVWLSYAVSPA